DLPGEREPAQAHLRRLTRLSALAAASSLFAAACVAVLVPLTAESVTSWQWSVDGRFPTDRGILLLIDIGMLVLVAAEVWLLVRIVRRRCQLKYVAARLVGA